jgi:uncharacterized protein (TIGR02246 family)
VNRTTTIAALFASAVAATALTGTASARTADTRCAPIDVSKVKALFVRWNDALQDITANKVVALYADDATLLPTVENGPYTKANGIRQYFVHFVERKPVATIDETKRFIKFGCNVAYDIGLYSFSVNGARPDNRETIRARYTFIYKWDGHRWLIEHHHSSVEPQQPQ